MKELCFDLANLRCLHAAAVWGKFARALFLECDELVFRRGGENGGHQFFFEHEQRAFEGFEIPARGRRVGGERAQPDDGIGGCFGGDALQLCGFQRVGALGEPRSDVAVFKTLCGGFVGRFSHSDRSLLEFFRDLHNGLRAPCKAVDAMGRFFPRARLVLVEGGVDPAQDGFERDAGVAPGFNKRPVECREQQEGSAATLEMFLNLGEVVEVIAHCLTLTRPTVGVGVVIFVDNAKAFKCEEFVDLGDVL